MKLHSTIAWLVMVLACACPASAADDSVEEGRARTIPWSGYWWPHYQGLLLEPLSKYDKLTASKSADWERKTHPVGEDVPKWHGYCHAWSASSLLEAEPRRSHTARHGERRMPLGVGDQKGLLAVCHAMDVANSYGDRFGDGRGSEDKHDLAPDVLWRLLKLYVKQQGVPLVLDVEAGPEVWNYPVYAYRIAHKPLDDAGQQAAQLTLWMADDAVPPDFVGVKVRRQTYQFTFQMRGNSLVMGSARWVGKSEKDHPDFAWYPYVARAENPEVDYETVKKLVQTGSTTTEAPTTPNPPSTNPTTPTPPTPPTPTPTPPTPNPPALEPPRIADPDNPRPEVGPAGQPATPRIALSPWELVTLVMNKTSSFKLDATVDRFDGGLYQEGDALRVSVSSERDGFLYLLYLDNEGHLAQLFPQPGQTNRIRAGEVLEFPSVKDGLTVRVGKPYGSHRIKAIVTARPLALSGLQVTYSQPEVEQPAQQQPAQQQPTQQQVAQEKKLEKDLPAQEPASPTALLLQFRWHPTQDRLIHATLQAHIQGQDTQAGMLDDDPRALLGPFAQDEVTFYVGPQREQPMGKPGKPQPVDKKQPRQEQQQNQKSSKRLGV